MDKRIKEKLDQIENQLRSIAFNEIEKIREPIRELGYYIPNSTESNDDLVKKQSQDERENFLKWSALIDTPRQDLDKKTLLHDLLKDLINKTIWDEIKDKQYTDLFCKHIAFYEESKADFVSMNYFWIKNNSMPLEQIKKNILDFDYNVKNRSQLYKLSYEPKEVSKILTSSQLDERKNKLKQHVENCLIDSAYNLFGFCEIWTVDEGKLTLVNIETFVQSVINNPYVLLDDTKDTPTLCYEDRYCNLAITLDMEQLVAFEQSLYKMKINHLGIRQFLLTRNRILREIKREFESCSEEVKSAYRLSNEKLIQSQAQSINWPLYRFILKCFNLVRSFDLIEKQKIEGNLESQLNQTINSDAFKKINDQCEEYQKMSQESSKEPGNSKESMDSILDKIKKIAEE